MKVQRRRGIAAIVGAVILFTMLFTIGTSYFLFVNNANSAYEQSLLKAGSQVQAGLNENIVVTTALVSSVGDVGFYLNNTGGQTVTLQSVFLVDSNSVVLSCFGTGITPPTGLTCSNVIGHSVGTGTALFPIALSPGQGRPLTSEGIYDLGSACDTKVCDVKVVTSNGNIFTATYPATGVSLAAQALSSGAIGDLYLAFQTYTWYNVTTGGTCPTSGTVYNDQLSSGYCLNNVKGKSAFDVPASVAVMNSCPSNCGIAFSVVVTDLNPSELSITLDEYSLIMDLTVHAGSGTVPIVWYIVSNSSTTIYQNYSPVTLQYNKPTLLLFASLNPVCSSGTCGSSNSFAPQYACGNSRSSCVGSGFTAPVFLVSHGWKGIPTTDTPNYGQNSPYVTTLYT